MTWGVAVTSPNSQLKVIEQVVSAGLKYLFPRIKRTVRRGGRRVKVVEPVLFNYIPVLLSAGWERLFDMRGVQDVIGPASDEEMDRIASYCDAEGIMRVEKIPEFKIGQSVRIASAGPLSDIVGVYQGTSERERQLALFNLFGSMRTMEFYQGDLVAA